MTDERAVLRSLLTKETPEDYSTTFWLLLSLIFVAATFVLILFVPAFYSIPLCFTAAAYMVYAEHKRNIHSPITISLAILYPVLYVLLLTNHPYSAYFGLGVFGWLTIVGVTLLLMKKPLTTLYAQGKGDMRLHYIISSIWAASWALSFLTAYLLMPDIWYLIAPFCITIATFGLIIYLTYFDRWLLTRREKEFTLGEYTFRQLSYPSKDFDDYIDFYARHMSEEVLQDPENYQMLRDAAHKYDAEAKAKIPFGAFHKGTLVGTCAIALSTREEKHPVEERTPVSFENVRKMGPIADLGRLVIAKNYRERPDVLRGLLKGVIEVAMEKDMVFFMSEVFRTGTTLHSRLGSTPLFKRSHPHYTVTFEPFGAVILLFNNLAATVFLGKEKLNSSTQLADIINQLLAEGWIKRQVIRHAFSRVEQKPWMHTIDSIRYLIDLATAKKEKYS